MIKIPDSKNYCEVYITLRCNLHCPYCINSHTGVQRSRTSLPPEEWIAGLNNIDFGNIPLTIGGGEPTFYPGFYDVVNGLNPKTKIDLLTNGTFDTDEFIKRIPPKRFTHKKEAYYKAIRMSYHIKSSNPEDLVQKAACLQDNGYSIGIFSINHPENLSANVAMTEICRKAGVYFFIRDFLGYYEDRLYGNYKYPAGLNGNKKKCRCKTDELLIAPDGKVHRCHKELYDGSNPIGDIGRIVFHIKDYFMPCDSFGLCSPCDLKQKISPDLTDKRCAAIIEESN